MESNELYIRHVFIYNKMGKIVYKGLMNDDAIGKRIAFLIKTNEEKPNIINIYANDNLVNIYTGD